MRDLSYLVLLLGSSLAAWHGSRVNGCHKHSLSTKNERNLFGQKRSERKLFGQNWSLSSCFFSDSFFAVTLLLSNRWCHIKAEAWRRLEVVATHSQCLFVYDEFWFGDQRYSFPYKMTNSVSIGNGKSVSEDIIQQSEKRETQNDDVFDESYGDKRITNAIKHLFVKLIVLFTVWNVSDVCHHVFQLSNVYFKKFLCSFSSWISNANSHLALFSFPVISVKNHKQSLTMATRIVSAYSSSAKLSFSFVKSTR